MKRIIAFLLSGCWHKWTIIDKRRLDYRTDFSSGSCDRYTLQCDRCGNLKTKDAK